MALEQFHQPVNAEPRITPDEQMHMIRQDLQLDEVLPLSLDRLGEDNLQALVYRWHQHPAPVLGAEHHVIPADREDVVAAAQVSHASRII
jgi:hypothetical protein